MNQIFLNNNYFYNYFYCHILSTDYIQQSIIESPCSRETLCLLLFEKRNRVYCLINKVCESHHQ